MGSAVMARGSAGIGGQLERLRAESSDIEALAVISVEGLVMACACDAETDQERLGAMTAAMLALGERIAAELQRGTLEQLLIRGDAGWALLMSLDENSVLCALASEEARLGLVLLDMRRARESLRRRQRSASFG